jgi:hypothetical protein
MKKIVNAIAAFAILATSLTALTTTSAKAGYYSSSPNMFGGYNTRYVREGIDSYNKRW